VITVRDLFFNVPARKKFLRTEQTETAHVASLVTHYSLAHPGKTFELTGGAGELLRVTPVATRRERVYQVFGGRTLDELIEIEGARRERPAGAATAEDDDNEPPRPSVFRLSGFLSRPQVQKSNRNSIYIFVNGRLIRDRLLLHSISSAYHNLMPAGCFPFALLFLECDNEEVDVNVHPSKTEVRFRHQSFVHDFVRDALREQLLESRPAPAFTASPAPQPAAAMPYSEFSQRLADFSDVPPSAGPSPAPVPQTTPFGLRPQAPPPARFDFTSAPIEIPHTPLSGPPQPAASFRLPVPDTHGAFPEEWLSGPVAPSLDVLRDLRPMGQLQESFIVAAGRDGLWLIDQHVAHERILFEKVLAQRAAGRVETQALLMPMVLQLTPEQQIRYARIAGELAAAGFDTEPFGHRTIAVKAAPAAIGPADLEKVLFEILETVEGDAKAVSMDDLRRHIAASLACRAAIKINTRLGQTKMEWLLTALAATDYPMACPHGRPIALHYSMREILKAFHRIS